MRILVTGSAGFVGSDLIPRLQKNGHFVTGIDIVEEGLSNAFFLHDLTKKTHLKLGNIDLCIHLASSVGGLLFNVKKQEIVEVNNAINASVLNLCQESGCKKMVFFSSINVFETSQVFKHERLERIDQKSQYGISKAQGEKLVEKEMPDFMIIRPTNLFGKNQTRKHANYGESHVIPDLLKKISLEPYVEVFGDGSQMRNFLHVSDVNNFLIKNLLFSGKLHFNLRSDITITIKDLVNELIRFTRSTKQVKFNLEYSKYELLKITNFEMGLPEEWGWNAEVNSISQGLGF